METTTLILEPRYRWEPGCEFLLCWSEGRTPGFPPLEADGAHSPGGDGVERAMAILSSGSLHAGQYGPGVAHGFWRARVWDVKPVAEPFPAGRMDIPDEVLDRGPGERWFAVEISPEGVSGWRPCGDRASAEDKGPNYAVGIEYLGGSEGSTP